MSAIMVSRLASAAAVRRAVPTSFDPENDSFCNCNWNIILIDQYRIGRVSQQRLVLPNMIRLYASKSYPPHTIIDMPALSPTMTMGNVGKWAKAPGDSLAPGDILVEIETDKAQMDFEFQDDGFLAKVLLDEGAKEVPVGKPIGVYVTSEEDVAAFADYTMDEAVVEQGGKPASEPAAAPAEAAPTPAASPAPASATVADEPEAPPADRILASPIAKKIALEQGIPLKNIKGSGPGGRIIKADVEGYKPPVAKAAPAAAAAAAAADTFTDVPISSMRKTIATRLTSSVQTSPHYFVSSTLYVSKLLKLREALNSTADGRYKLSVNDLLVKAMALASLQVPVANSAWLEAEGVIRQYSVVDVSVAVSTPAGLITPIVKNAHAKGLATISKEVKDLGKRARDGKLKPEEYVGGTITISNMGMNSAVTSFTSIINPPQSTILAIGTTERKAVEDVDGGIKFEDVMTITGSFDHRVVDGAVGGEYMKALKRIVENPLELLL
ncbi:2-oxoacid dehydrogenases acyltransferase-domain-containing protein [Lipomyces arxii]|uniref:2-oxoacid dehydrogenases acyltransferase-domain-containing protein n=1 Tax=Lipomyces arxii TaxID=56418 RepID=UPI0034CD751E